MNKTHYQGRYLILKETDGWEYVSRRGRSDVVIIVAVTPDNKLLMVEQYRIPVASFTIELPAGLVGDVAGQSDESLQQAAHRELLEETGYQADSLNLLHHGPTSAGLCDEQVVIFQAHDLQRIDAGGGDDSEDITVHSIQLNELDSWLQNQLKAGKLLDPKIYAALYWLHKAATQ